MSIKGQMFSKNSFRSPKNLDHNVTITTHIFPIILKDIHHTENYDY